MDELGVDRTEAIGEVRAPVTDRHFDFFISFEDTKSDHAAWLFEVIENAGYRAYNYREANAAGDRFPSIMTDLLGESDTADGTRKFTVDHVICLFSAKYFDPDRVSRFELERAWLQDLSGQNRRLLWITFDASDVVESPFDTFIGLALGAFGRDEHRDLVEKYLKSAKTGEGFGYTRGSTRIDETFESDFGVTPWAMWLPPYWQPTGSEPLPLDETCGFRVDALWARDESPFRAVLADRRHAALTAMLNETEACPQSGERRRWYHLRSLSGRGHQYSDRDSVLDQLTDPPERRDLPIGVVVGLTLTESAGITAAVELAISQFTWLSGLLASDALILRVEGGRQTQAVWVAAEIGGRLRRQFPIDVATRLRTVGDADDSASDLSLGRALTLIDERRSKLGSATWRPVGLIEGVDPNAGVVKAFNDGAASKAGIDEATFLRHARDHLAEFWRSMVRDYAAEREENRWYNALAVVAESTSDLRIWAERAAASGAANPIRFPERVLGRIDGSLMRRVASALHRCPELQQKWLASAPAAGAPRPEDIRRCFRERAEGGLVDVSAVEMSDHDAYWISLGCDVTDRPGRGRLRLDDTAIMSQRAERPADPKQRTDATYARALVRPFGGEC